MIRRTTSWRQAVRGLLAALGVVVVGSVLAATEEAPPATRRPSPEEDLAAKRAEGWSPPLPAVSPAPTYWPVVLALGITLMAGGIATEYLYSAVGMVVFVVAAVGWIRDVVQETKES